MNTIEDYLFPGASSSTLAEAMSLPGVPAQQAYNSEYNIFGIILRMPSSNPVGVLDPTGNSPGLQTIGNNDPTGNLRNGQTGYNTGIGFFLGSNAGTPVFSLGNPSTNSVTWDGTTLTIVGTLNASSINIPDVTTANSFHVDSSGNSWWGSNLATGYAGAMAYILATGAAVFKSVNFGGSGIQYTAANDGMFTFGDGNDGDAVLDGSNTYSFMSKSGSDYTLLQDVYFGNLTFSGTCTLTTGNYRIFGLGTLTMPSGTQILNKGNAGGNGGNGTAQNGGIGSTGGAAIAAGYFVAGEAGTNGNQGATGATTNASGSASATGQNGTSVSHSLGSSGVAGVRGGQGGAAGGHQGGVAGAAGSSGTAIAALVRLLPPWLTSFLLDIDTTGATIKMTQSAAPAGSSSGGGGASDSVSNIGGGGAGAGAGGSPGGIVAITFRIINMASGSTISVRGGNGGNGGNGANGTSGGTQAGGGGAGAGGQGGNGGTILLVYNSATLSGTLNRDGGTGGTAGSAGSGAGGGGAGQPGTNGNDGGAGILRQFQITM